MTKLGKITTFGIVIAILVVAGFSIWFFNPDPKIRNEVVENGCNQSATTTDCAELVKKAQERELEEPLIPISTATSYTEVFSTTQSGKIDEHLTIDNTLTNVTFCERLTFKSRQIFIDGVDIVQRIAYLASNELTEKDPDGITFGQRMCDSMPHNVVYTKGILKTRDVTTFDGMNDGFTVITGKTYGVNIGSMQYAINPSANEIFVVGGFGGKLTKIGSLK